MRGISIFGSIKKLVFSKAVISCWAAQRITAVALIPLGLWVVGNTLLLKTASYKEVCQWISSSSSALYLILFIPLLYYHGYLGVKIVVEDYLPQAHLRKILLRGLRVLSISASILSMICVLKIALQNDPSL